MASPKLAITYLVEGQVNAETIANDAWNRLETFASLAIVDRDLTAPPGSPVTGSAYIIAASPTGAWAGQAAKITFYFNGWIFITPAEGMRIWVNDENKFFIYDGSAWVVQPREAAAVANLGSNISATYVEAEVQAIVDKLDALLTSLRAADVIA